MLQIAGGIILALIILAIIFLIGFYIYMIIAGHQLEKEQKKWEKEIKV